MKLHQLTSNFGIIIYTIGIIFSLIGCNRSDSEGFHPRDSLATTRNTQNIGNSEDLSFLQDTNYRIADSLLDLKDGENAILYLEKTLKKFQTDSNYRAIVSVLNKLGLSYIIMRKFSTSLPCSKQAAEIAIKHIGEKDTLLADSYYQMGLCYDQTYKADSALDYQQKALKIRQDIYGNMHRKVADSYLAIGNVYNWVLYDAYNASENYYSALNIMENMKAEDKEFMIRCYYNLAETNREIGELDKALVYANEMINRIDSSLYNNKIFKELAFTLVANIYFSKKEYDKAIQYYKRAIQLNIKNNLKENNYLAMYYTNLGLLFQLTNDLTMSIDYCNKAEKILLPEKPVSLSYVYNYLAKAYWELRQYEIAKSYLLKCIALRKTYYSDKHPQTSMTYLNLGRFFYELNRIDSASFYLYQALVAGTKDFKPERTFSLPKLESIGNNYFLYKALAQLANLQDLIYENTGQTDYLKYAMDLYNLCDTLLESSRTYTSQDVTKFLLAENHKTIYEHAINTAYTLFELSNDSSYLNYIFHFIEKNRARVLYENVKKNEFLSSSILPDSIKSEETKLNYQVNYYKKRIAEKTVLSDSTMLLDLNNKLYKVFRKQETLQDYIRQKYSIYYQVMYESDGLLLKDIKQNLESTIIIEYFWGEDNIYALRIERDLIDIIRIKKDSIFISNLEKVIDLLHCNNVFSFEEYIAFTDNCYYLFKCLLQPLLMNKHEKYSANKLKLVIIPDENLAYLPFESLITKRPINHTIDYKNLDYLINEYDISYDFSSRFFQFSVSKSTERRVNKLLAIGYSEQESNTLDNRKKNSTTLPVLKASENEIKSLSKVCKGKYLVDEEATETNFKSFGASYDVLHLAVHGKSDSAEMHASCLYFNNARDTMNDGILYPYELYNTPLNAKLAVLSACETGIGKMQAGEGLLSMGWGFAYAGCESLVLSLWKANDLSTSIIMKSFYQEVIKKEDIDKALSKSKIKYLEKADEYTAHPSNWATFIIYGNTKSLDFPNIKELWWIIISSLLGISIIFFGIRKRRIKSQL